MESPPTSSLKDQVGGNHYRVCSIQPITYIQANNLGYEEGNVVKYVTRHADKGGAEDLKKAIQYIEFVLECDYHIIGVTDYHAVHR